MDLSDSLTAEVLKVRLTAVKLHSVLICSVFDLSKLFLVCAMFLHEKSLYLSLFVSVVDK